MRAAMSDFFIRCDECDSIRWRSTVKWHLSRAYWGARTWLGFGRPIRRREPSATEFVEREVEDMVFRSSTRLTLSLRPGESIAGPTTTERVREKRIIREPKWVWVTYPPPPGVIGRLRRTLRL
jgi:hypothetical protein